jgi:thiamine pyrophosphokinase
MTGTKYEVENVSLDTNFPLGVSNEITEEFAEICVKEGRLLIILSKKD